MVSPGGYTAPFLARRTWHTVLDWLYPDDGATCRLCRRPMLLSAASLQAVVSICPFCLQDVDTGQVDGRRREMPLPGARARKTEYFVIHTAHAYEGVLRDAVRQWKYDGAVDLTAWFADMLTQIWVTESMTRGRHRDKVVLVPVPTTRHRFARRGYHHTLLLAEQLGGATRLPVEQILLRRPDDGGALASSQTAKDRRERIRSLTGTFLLDLDKPVAGRRFLLVDDVVTTGATLYTCAQVLFAAGAAEVTAVAIADVD